MKYAPIKEKIVWILQNKSNNKMELESFVEIFEKQFGAEEAKLQLDILIDWGRYSEHISYDEKAEVLYLEKETEEAVNE